MTKLFFSILIIISMQCTPSKISLNLQEHSKNKEKRNNYQLGKYELNYVNKEFVKAAQYKFAFAFKRSFNDVQTLYHLFKTNTIDSFAYQKQLLKLQEEYTIRKKHIPNIPAFNEIIEDTNYNAEVKVLIAKKYNNEFTLIVDENNNNEFSDDHQIAINKSNYDSILNTTYFTVKNLYAKRNEKIYKHDMRIMVNDLFSTVNSFETINSEAEINVWIDISTYYNVIKKKRFKKADISISVSNYNLNYLDINTAINHYGLDKKKVIKREFYPSNKFKYNSRWYFIDSISKAKRKAYIKKLASNNFDSSKYLAINESQETLNNNLLNFNGNRIDIFDLFKESKDSIIVIDFWASWCKPCREETPWLKKVEQELKDFKIKFISISFDTNIEAWKEASLTDSISNKDNFLLINSWQSDFAVKYNLYTIPRYMIVNKNGLIINDNAPRPSSKSFKKKVLEYLNNN